MIKRNPGVTNGALQPENGSFGMEHAYDREQLSLAKHIVRQKQRERFHGKPGPYTKVPAPKGLEPYMERAERLLEEQNVVCKELGSRAVHQREAVVEHLYCPT